MNRQLTATLAFLGLCLANSDCFAAQHPKPITTNKSRFRIPFKFDASALQRMNALELQLHVSSDRGLTWDMTQSLAPDGGKFEYQAPSDGEYWFSVKTLDGRNQLHPPVGAYETGLIVVVDTTPPLLDVSLQEVSPGKVHLSWHATDTNIDPSTLKLEYYQPGNESWESVDVSPRVSGQTTWSVTQAGQIAARGTIADTAGNFGRGESKVQIAATGIAPPPKSNRRVPIAGIEASNENSELAIEDHESTVVPNTRPDVLRDSQASNNRFPIRQRQLPGHENPSVVTPFGVSSAKSIAVPSVLKNSTGTPVIAADRWPVISESVASQTEQIYQMPLRHRLVNTRRFQVGYQINDIGPSGIGRIELFITQDNGRNWSKYGDDPDQRSPFDVEVLQDGEYGFAIRVRSGVGIANHPPLPDEPPAIIVSVDQMPPRLEVLPVQQGQGANVNRLQIRWRIQDEHPAEKPVSLYYAAGRNGPWETISDWTEDDGRFEWTVDAGVPSKFFLRVLARDSAGNVNKMESVTPVVVDLSHPSARIVDVEAPQTVGPR